MTLSEILELVSQAGGELIPNGDKLVMQAPAPLPDNLRQAIRQHKNELMELLQAQAPEVPERPGKIGRWGAPCPVCNDEWQWPCMDGRWICSWCFVQGRIIRR